MVSVTLNGCTDTSACEIHPAVGTDELQIQIKTMTGKEVLLISKVTGETQNVNLKQLPEGFTLFKPLW